MVAVLLCVGCMAKKTEKEDVRDSIASINIDRFDVLQHSYVMNCDYSALQQMSLTYPTETRTLIEDVLQIGKATDMSINADLLQFYQDTTLAQLAHDAEVAYEDMSDVEHNLRTAFTTLHQMLPQLPLPSFYAQIGALQQSIIVNDTRIGISLEKYLGTDYPLYMRYYSPSQRAMMTRQHIVADCLSFYLLSRYGLNAFDMRQQWERDVYIAKIQWVANRCMEKPVFDSAYLKRVDKYMRRHRHTKIDQLLKDDNLQEIQEMRT